MPNQPRLPKPLLCLFRADQHLLTTTTNAAQRSTDPSRLKRMQPLEVLSRRVRFGWTRLYTDMHFAQNHLLRFPTWYSNPSA